MYFVGDETYPQLVNGDSDMYTTGWSPSGGGGLPSSDIGAGIISTAGNAISANDAKNITEDAVVAKINALELSMLLTRDRYLSGPATAETQQAALNEINAGIAWLSGPEFLGNTGLRKDWMRQGYADRIRGGKYDWYAAYLDPVAEDPRRQSFTGQAVGQFEGAAQVVGLKGWQLALALSVVGVGLWLALRSKS